MAYEIIEKLPSAEEHNRLRRLVNWSVYEPEIIVRALPQSLYCVCALLEDDIVGMARVLGDGGLVYYTQDVIVHPNHQRQGIGAQMMERVMAYIGSHASQNSIIGLMSAYGKEPFFEKYGFVKRPTDRLGCGIDYLLANIPIKIKKERGVGRYNSTDLLKHVHHFATVHSLVGLRTPFQVVLNLHLVFEHPDRMFFDGIK